MNEEKLFQEALARRRGGQAALLETTCFDKRAPRRCP
jgi:hypothetical protein